eukprot:TRINITY_DN4048_c0_g1_i1.p2 TRINITY_DN4048_c0_g1~~TRINITY_DN4048_c0_g1_i1.p2  ORF type:complete len:124 (-),score=11.19 TRINITY_DN4048_c0_g1_i1:590-961(-)
MKGNSTASYGKTLKSTTGELLIVKVEEIPEVLFKEVTCMRVNVMCSKFNNSLDSEGMTAVTVLKHSNIDKNIGSMLMTGTNHLTTGEEDLVGETNRVTKSGEFINDTEQIWTTPGVIRSSFEM